TIAATPPSNGQMRHHPISPGGLFMRCRHALLVIGSLSLAAGTAPAQPVPLPPYQPARVDRHGDLLPSGASHRLSPVRFEHAGGVIAAAFSPDGKTILAAGMENKGLSLRYWETATGKETARMDLADANLIGLAFTPDGNCVIVGRSAIVELYDR